MDSLLNSIPDVNVAVVGDLILDRYTWGSVSRISPEAPVPVVDVDETSLKLGGAGNAAKSISALGAEVTVYGRIGTDQAGQKLRALVNTKDISLYSLPNEDQYPTTVKNRVIAGNQHLVRLDTEDRNSIPRDEITEKSSDYRTRMQSHDVILLSDYGKGVLSADTIEWWLDLFDDLNVPVVVDPHSQHFSLYRDIDLITPNERELREGSGTVGPEKKSLRELVDRSFEHYGFQNILVTRGEKGMKLFESTGDIHDLNAQAREVFDVTGAGDTVAGFMAIGEGLDADRIQIMELANLAAGIVVGKMGTAAVSRSQLRSLL